MKDNGKSSVVSVTVSLCFSVLLCAALLTAVFFSEKKSKSTDIAAEAPPELVSLANADPAEVDRQIKKQRSAKQLDMQAEKIESGEIDLWSLFDDSVFLGDSRAVGFSYYHYIKLARVLAGGGNSIRDALGHLDEIKALSPSCVYFCYGLNDTGVGYWKNGDEYAAELDRVFTAYQKALPDTTLVASSILPATEAALLRSPVWRKIPDFDRALKEKCAEYGVIYVDNSELAEKYMSTLWNDDGVHLNRAFYPYWAKNLYLTKLAAEAESNG